MVNERLSRRRLLRLTGLSTGTVLAGCITAEEGGGPGQQAAPPDRNTQRGGPPDDRQAPPRAPAGITVPDQRTRDRTIRIPRVRLPQPGWLAIFPAAADGSPEEAVPLATKRLPVGTTANVRLTIEALAPGEQTLFASLHLDDPADESFTFPRRADPRVTRDGRPIIEPFDVDAAIDRRRVALVLVRDRTFEPMRLSVDRGTTVRWINADPFAHEIQSGQFDEFATDWSFQAALSAGNRVASFTFEGPGVYEYFCPVHGRNRGCGAVLVGDVSLPVPLPCEERGPYGS